MNWNKKLESRTAQCFDLLAGTSIGGIVALGLALEAAYRNNLARFEKHGQNIFSYGAAQRSRIAKGIDIGRSLFTSKYKSDGLRKALEKLLNPFTLLGNLKHPVVIPTINLPVEQHDFEHVLAVDGRKPFMILLWLHQLQRFFH
ncbi:patatin-like phospholipase family protein [Nostoc sp.]